MSKLLEMLTGSLIDPFLIRSIVKFQGKGVIFRNEYNKIVVFEAEPDAQRQDVIAKVVGNIINSGKNWQQPDWNAEFAKAALAAKVSADPKMMQGNTNKAA